MRKYGGDAAQSVDDLAFSTSSSQEVVMNRRRRSQRDIWSKRFSVSFVIAVLLPFAALSTQSLSVAAAEIRSGSDPNVKTGETVDDDLYIFGGDVEIAGTVK